MSAINHVGFLRRLHETVERPSQLERVSADLDGLTRIVREIGQEMGEEKGKMLMRCWNDLAGAWKANDAEPLQVLEKQVKDYIEEYFGCEVAVAPIVAPPQRIVEAAPPEVSAVQITLPPSKMMEFLTAIQADCYEGNPHEFFAAFNMLADDKAIKKWAEALMALETTPAFSEDSQMWKYARANLSDAIKDRAVHCAIKDLDFNQMRHLIQELYGDQAENFMKQMDIPVKASEETPSTPGLGSPEEALELFTEINTLGNRLAVQRWTKMVRTILELPASQQGALWQLVAVMMDPDHAKQVIKFLIKVNYDAVAPFTDQMREAGFLIDGILTEAFGEAFK